MSSFLPANAAADDRGRRLKVSFGDGLSHDSIPSARKLDSAMHEKDDALSHRAASSCTSGASVCPDDSRDYWDSNSTLHVADAQDQTSESSSISITTANSIGSSSSAADCAVLFAVAPNCVSEEGQGESTCDQQYIRTGRSKKRSHGFAAGENSLEPPRSRGRCANSAIRHSVHTSEYLSQDVEQEQEYFRQILGSSSYGWTDEKHSSYLDSMEADFLRSFMFREFHEESASVSSLELTDSATSQRVSHDEFKICQNGKWRPISVPTTAYAGPLTHVAVAVKNPWIRRFRSPCKRKLAPSVVTVDPPV